MLKTEREVLEMNISIFQITVDRLEEIKKERKLNRKELSRYTEDLRILNKWKKELSILKVLED